MIKSAKLRRFQPHEFTTLNFCPGVNVIHGKTDHGKSAIMRGLYWGLFNQAPSSGLSFRTHGSKDGVCVDLEFADCEVGRERWPDFNGYTLNGKDLAAVRTGVPDVVAEAVNMNSVNVQRQLEAPYLLGCTPPEVARVLNAAAGLDGIDNAFAEIDKRIRENQSDQRQSNAIITESLAKLDAFTGIDKLKGEVDAYIMAKCQLANIQKQERVLSDAVADLKEMQSTCEIVPDLKELRAALRHVSHAWENLSVSEETLKEIETFADSIAVIDAKLKTRQLQLTRLRETLRKEFPNCPYCGAPRRNQ